MEIGEIGEIGIPPETGSLATTVTPPLAELCPERAPADAWGFESIPFPIRLRNRGLLALARPETATQLVGTADLHMPDGRLVRRLLETPVPHAVPVGGSELFGANLNVQAFAGDYVVKLGLHRRVPTPNGGTRLEELPIETEEAPLRVRNTIFDAFVELVNSCNFRCTFCPQGELTRKQRPMDFELAKKVVADLAAMGHHYPIRVHLMGEPMLYPRFFDFVEYAHSVGQRIVLATNGSRFQPDRIEKIFSTKLDEMVVSLNTPEREEYERQRGTDLPFEAYMAGIEAMVTEIVRRGAPPATRINVLYDLAKANDPSELARIRTIVAHWVRIVRNAGGKVAADVHETVQLDPRGTTLLKLCDGLELQWTPYHAWGEGAAGNQQQEPALRRHVPQMPRMRDHFCSFPWRQLAVLVDGRTTACCVDAEGQISLGDARTQSVEEIWNGPELNRIRDGFLRSRAVHPKCATCHIHHEKEQFFPAPQIVVPQPSLLVPAVA